VVTSGPDPRSLFDVTREGAVVLRVHAQPGVTHPGIAGTHGDAVKVRVDAPAERGRANAALEQLLATVFDVPRTSVAVVSGATSRAKRVRIDGLRPDDAVAALHLALDRPAN
jgi:uncharacterized protein